MPVVLREYKPVSLFNTHFVDEIERFESRFFGSPVDEQLSYLSDVFLLHRKYSESGDYRIQDYPNLTLGLIADTVKTSDGLKKILPVSKDVYPELVIKAARRGYRIDMPEVLPIIRIIDVTNGLKRIVSVYSILDEEI